MPAPEGGQRLSPEHPVWVADGAVHVNGRVVLREGVLEMFACPPATKEHESVVAVESPAFLLHTALLAVGAEPGGPVKFNPKYKPPSGTPIEVVVYWSAEDGKKTSAKAQDWIRHTDTKEAMDLPFVFAGSGFWTDPDTGQQHYLAESGELICVSNFGAAMLDVPAPSTQQNGELWFEPFTERIPPIETPVQLVLRPVKEKGAKKPTQEAAPVATEQAHSPTAQQPPRR